MDPYLLDLKRFIKDLLINNNIIKANIFIAKFFPKTKTVNFSNIVIEATIKQIVFNISSIILIKEINKLIKSLLNKKVLGLNNILNKVFKVIALSIVKTLIKAVSCCFTSKVILKHFKKSIIVVLCKEEKKTIFS